MAAICVVSMPVSASSCSPLTLQRDDDLLERRVARALADAVHGALDLLRAGLDCGERVRDREPEVVVAVGRERHLPELGAPAADGGDEAPRTRAGARSRRCRGG